MGHFPQVIKVSGQVTPRTHPMSCCQALASKQHRCLTVYLKESLSIMDQQGISIDHSPCQIDYICPRECLT